MSLLPTLRTLLRSHILSTLPLPPQPDPDLQTQITNAAILEYLSSKSYHATTALFASEAAITHTAKWRESAEIVFGGEWGDCTLQNVMATGGKKRGIEKGTRTDKIVEQVRSDIVDVQVVNKERKDIVGEKELYDRKIMEIERNTDLIRRKEVAKWKKQVQSVIERYQDQLEQLQIQNEELQLQTLDLRRQIEASDFIQTQKKTTTETHTYSFSSQEIRQWAQSKARRKQRKEEIGLNPYRGYHSITESEPSTIESTQARMPLEEIKGAPSQKAQRRLDEHISRLPELSSVGMDTFRTDLGIERREPEEVLNDENINAHQKERNNMKFRPIKENIPNNERRISPRTTSPLQATPTIPSPQHLDNDRPDDKAELTANAAISAIQRPVPVVAEQNVPHAAEFPGSEAIDVTENATIINRYNSPTTAILQHEPFAAIEQPLQAQAAKFGDPQIKARQMEEERLQRAKLEEEMQLAEERATRLRHLRIEESKRRESLLYTEEVERRKKEAEILEANRIVLEQQQRALEVKEAEARALKEQQAVELDRTSKLDLLIQGNDTLDLYMKKLGELRKQSTPPEEVIMDDTGHTETFSAPDILSEVSNGW